MNFTIETKPLSFEDTYNLEHCLRYSVLLIKGEQSINNKTEAHFLLTKSSVSQQKPLDCISEGNFLVERIMHLFKIDSS